MHWPLQLLTEKVTVEPRLAELGPLTVMPPHSGFAIPAGLVTALPPLFGVWYSFASEAVSPGSNAMPRASSKPRTWPGRRIIRCSMNVQGLEVMK